MIHLFNILKEENLIKIYEEAMEKVNTNLENRSKLFSIDSPLELDKNLEYMHEAKMFIDNAIRILEYKKIELSVEYNDLKELNKINIYQIEIAYDSLNKQKKEDLTKVDYEKQREVYYKKKLKEDLDKYEELDVNIKVLSFELNCLNRLRENIDDIYLSLKKKYESFLKLRM